jgi:YesN/AraC family two-component response regulator
MELPDDYRAVWQQVYDPKLGEVLETSETFDELQPALERLFEEADAELAVMREGRSKYALIRSIRSYIDEHYGNPDLSLVHLSDAFGVPSKYVSQVFKEECGQNFVDYVADIRLERAKQLLAETDLKVQDIAAEVGYLHTFSFTRVFKKTLGLTPGEYRKKLE